MANSNVVAQKVVGSIAGTGHRPPRLGLDYSSKSNEILTNFLINHISEADKPPLIITGGAQGLDQCLAHAAHILGIPYWVCVPFEGQETRWPVDARKRYVSICDRAARLIFVSKGGYSPTKFILRDQFMVDCAESVLALYDEIEIGGTFQTVKYALEQGKKVENLYGKWQTEKEKIESSI